MSLRKLKADATMALLDNQGKKIDFSPKKGNVNEKITATLEARDYYIQVTLGTP